MSAKKRIFPPQAEPGSPGEWEDQDQPGEDASGSMPFGGGKNAREHAASAYAANEYEIPPQPKASRFGPIGGLFTDDAAGPEGHGLHAHANTHPPDNGGNLLSVIAQDALEEECKKRVCPSCAVSKEAEDTRLRALADLENTKKRLAREREEQTRFAAEAVLSDIIPSLDNLDLALQHAGSNDACRNFVVGVQMTRKLMQEALAKHGLVQAGAVGEEFNPALHEAVGMQPSADVPEGHICGLLSSGYSLNGRLLRPAKVMVCKN